MLILHENKTGLVLHQYLTKDSAGKRVWAGLGVDSKDSKCLFNSGAKFSSVTVGSPSACHGFISLDKRENGSDSSFLMLCTTSDLSLS